jgi:hypothetical protein
MEKSSLNAIIAKISDKDTFNFFTDEGLLPNYSFPEAGVTLRSIILKKKAKADQHGKYKSTIFEYERPAATAISELAPANRFYAEGRMVTVDQIDMALSTIEEVAVLQRVFASRTGSDRRRHAMLSAVSQSALEGRRAEEADGPDAAGSGHHLRPRQPHRR